MDIILKYFSYGLSVPQIAITPQNVINWNYMGDGGAEFANVAAQEVKGQESAAGGGQPLEAQSSLLTRETLNGYPRTIEQIRQTLGIPRVFNLEQYQQAHFTQMREVLEQCQDPLTKEQQPEEVNREQIIRQQNLTAILRILPLNLKMARARLRAKLRLQGIGRTDQLIRMFEVKDSITREKVPQKRSDAGDSFQRSYLKGCAGRAFKDIYQELESPEAFAFLKGVKGPSLALQRFQLLGGEVEKDLFRVADEKMMTLFSQLGGMSEKQFQQMQQNLKRYPFLRIYHDNSGLPYIEEHRQRIFDRLDSVPLLASGQLPEAVKETLNKLQRIYQFTRRLPEYLGTNCQQILQNPLTDDTLMILETALAEKAADDPARAAQLISVDSFDKNNIYHNLVILERMGLIQSLAKLSRLGWGGLDNIFRSPYSEYYEKLQKHTNTALAWMDNIKTNPEAFEMYSFQTDADLARRRDKGRDAEIKALGNRSLLSLDSPPPLVDQSVQQTNLRLLSGITSLLGGIAGDEKARRAVFNDVYSFNHEGLVKGSWSFENCLMGKLSPELLNERQGLFLQFWQEQVRAKPNLATNDFFIQYLVANQDRIEEIISGNRLTTLAFEELQRLYEGWEARQKESKFSADYPEQVYSIFLDPNTCPKEFMVLAHLYSDEPFSGDYSFHSAISKSYREWGEFIDRSGNPKEALLDFLGEKGNPEALDYVLKQTEAVKFLPEQDKKFWDMWQDLPSTTKDLFSLGYRINKNNFFLQWKKAFLGEGSVSTVLLAMAGQGLTGLTANFLAEGRIFQLIPESERKFWQAWQELPNVIQTAFAPKAAGIDLSNEVVIKQLKTFAEIYQLIEQSSSKEIKNFASQLLGLLADSENPGREFEQIRAVFERNYLPEAGKTYKVFTIIYPPDKLDKTLKENANLSPVLTGASFRRRYDIIYKDLLRVHIESANSSLYVFLKAIQGGQAVMDKALAGENLSEADYYFLNRFLNQMDVLYANSLYGKRKEEVLQRDLPFMERINLLRQSFGLREGQTLSERVSEMFVGPLGYESLDKVITRMETIKSQTDQKNREVVRQMQEQGQTQFQVKSGDCLKGIDDNYLDVILRNGSVAKEYLGAAACSDSTPFDTDTGMVSEADAKLGLAGAIAASPAKNYGSLFFVFQNHGQFQDTDNQQAYRYDPHKYERFASGVVGEKHYGIRTGIPSTEIDFIAVGTDLVNNQDSWQKILFTIAQNGYYIPVVDENGALLVTPDQLDQYKVDVNRLSQVLAGDEVPPEQAIEIFTRSPYLQTIYSKSVGVGEGYTLGQHTTMVLRQFERYLANELWPWGSMDKTTFRKILMVHDLGKPVAIDKTGNKEAHHEYTEKFLPRMWEALKVPVNLQDLATALVEQDYLGDYFKGHLGQIQIAGEIKNKAADLGISARQFCVLLTRYYIADAGSYTEDAGGVRSLDNLFIFNRQIGANRGHVSFAPELAEKWRTLFSLLPEF